MSNEEEKSQPGALPDAIEEAVDMCTFQITSAIHTMDEIHDRTIREAIEHLVVEVLKETDKRYLANLPYAVKRAVKLKAEAGDKLKGPIKNPGF